MNVVKGSAKHEEQVLKEVTEARAQAASIKLTSDDLTDPEKMAAFQKAQDQLKGSLSRLMVVQEAYPDLKANSAFHDLQVQLEGTENRILRSREQYNDAVRDYNAELGKIHGAAVKQGDRQTVSSRASSSRPRLKPTLRPPSRFDSRWGRKRPQTPADCVSVLVTMGRKRPQTPADCVSVLVTMGPQAAPNPR